MPSVVGALVRRLAPCALLLGPLLASAPSARAQAPAPALTGRVTGTVLLSPSIASRRARVRLYTDYGPGSAPPGAPADTNELHNVVIYLDSAPPVREGDAGVPAARPVEIEQRQEAFVPHVLPVLQGTTVAFPNGDPYFHNVFSLSRTLSFDLGLYPKGVSRSIRFPKAGIVQVFCHLHSDMSAVVMVLSNPFFATPDTAGNFVIEGIPPGDYRVVAWHERTRPVTRRIRVVPGEATVVDFSLPLTDAPRRR